MREFEQAFSSFAPKGQVDRHAIGPDVCPPWLLSATRTSSSAPSGVGLSKFNAWHVTSHALDSIRPTFLSCNGHIIDIMCSGNVAIGGLPTSEVNLCMTAS